MITNKLNEDLLISFTLKVLGALGGYFVTLVIARSYDIEEASTFYILFSFYTFIIQSGKFGIDFLILRDKRYKGHIIKPYSFLLLSLLISIILLIVTVFLSTFFDYSDLNYDYLEFNLIAASGVLAIIFNQCALSLQVKGKTFISVTIINIVPNYFLLFCLLTFKLENISSLLLLFMLLNFTNLILSYLIVRRINGGWNLSKLFNSLGDIWNDFKYVSIPSWLNVLARQLTIFLPIFISTVKLTNLDNAILNSSFRVTLVFGLVLVSINYVVAPKFSKLYNNSDYVSLNLIYHHVLKLLYFIAVPLSIFIISLDDFVMGLFGKEYANYGYIFSIIAFGQVISIITGPSGILLVMSGNQKLVMKLGFLGLCITSIISNLLIDYFGLTGAAVSILLSYAILNIPTFCFAYHNVKKLLKQ